MEERPFVSSDGPRPQRSSGLPMIIVNVVSVSTTLSRYITQRHDAVHHHPTTDIDLMPVREESQQNQDDATMRLELRIGVKLRCLSVKIEPLLHRPSEQEVFVITD